MATDPEWLGLDPPPPERAAVLSQQAHLVALPTLRTMPWPPFAVAFVLGCLALYAASRADPPPPEAGLPAVGALIATWFASLLGDHSAPIAHGTPPHVLFRRVVRLAMGSPIVVVLWIAAVAYADEGPYAGTLSFLFGAELSIALGLAAIALHVVDPGREVLWAGSGLVVVFVGAPFVLGVDLAPIPSADTWWLREGRWLAIGGGGVLGFLLASLDPARSHLLRLPRLRRASAMMPRPAR